MHDDPRDDATDPSDLTQRHATPPVEPVAPVDSERARARPPIVDADPGGIREPRQPPPAAIATRPRPSARADWARDLGRRRRRSPRSAGTSPRRRRPRPPRRPPRRGAARSGSGSLVAAALLSAVLASGGTVLALGAAGALDRPARRVDRAGRHQRRRRPAGRHRRVVGDHRRRRQGQPGRRADHRHRPRRHRQPGSSRETGVGSGVIFDSNGWILTNHHVVEGGETFDVELKDGRILAGTRLRHRHADRPRHRQGRCHGPADRRDRRLGRAQGRPAGDRHRQPARDLLELGHERDRVGQGPLDHDRRQPDR